MGIDDNSHIEQSTDSPQGSMAIVGLGGSEHSHSPSRHFSWPVVIVFAGALVLLLISFGAYAMWGRANNSQPHEASADKSASDSESPSGERPNNKASVVKPKTNAGGNSKTSTKSASSTAGSSNNTSSKQGDSAATGGAGAGSAGAGSTGGDSGCDGSKITGGAATASGGPGIEPGAANAGVPAGTCLTVVNGNVTVTTPGTVIDAEYIKGFLNIKASNVTVKNSIIEGGVATGNGAVVNIKSGTGILLDHDEIFPVHPSVYLDGIWGSNVTMQYLNIHGGVDGMKLGGNSTVQYSWIHGLDWFSSDPNQGGGSTHNDTIQIMGGIGIHVQYNNLQATASNNSAIQVTQDSGTVTNLYVQKNWADGGGCTFNFSGHGPGGVLLNMSGITVTDNLFGPDRKFSGCAILIDNQTTITQSGNKYEGTGAPVVIQQHN